MLHAGTRLSLRSVIMAFAVMTAAACSSAPTAPAVTAPDAMVPAPQAPAAADTSATAAPAATGGAAGADAAGEIGPGVSFERGARFHSPSGDYYLNFNQDGNIVVYRSADDGYVWGLNSVPLVEFTRAVKAEMRPDGRFVVTDAAGAELWSVPQENPQPGSKLTLDDTGALQVVAPGNAVAWTSADTNKILGDRTLPIAAGATIERQYRYVSKTGTHFLMLQNDGNLVVGRMSDAAFIWGLNTISGVPIMSGAKAGVTPEGKLTVWAADDSVMWAVPESGSDSSAKLDLTPEGTLNLSIANNDPSRNATVWASREEAPASSQVAAAATSAPADAQAAATATSTAPSAAAPSGPAESGPMGILKAGEELTVGKEYVSQDGRYKVVFPQDGNLHVRWPQDPDGDPYIGGFYNYDKSGAWKRAKHAKIAADGNLVMTDEKGAEVWSSNVPTPDPGMQLHISDQGDLQLRRPSGEIAWSMTGKTSPSIRAARVLPGGAPPMTAEETAILEKHNQLRALHDTPALQWSPVLAAEAKQWADTCTMKHATNTNGSGENLAAFHDADNMLVRVQSWYDEVKVYNYGNPGFNKGGSSQETQTGHFTQVVWKATTQLGCAKAMCPSGPYPGWLVCRYWPGGNYADGGLGGEAAAYKRNVLPLK